MPGVFNLQGPQTSATVYGDVTGNGALGKAHDKIDNSAMELIHHRDKLQLTGEGYETRWRKFKNTTKTFFRAGGDVGSVVGTAVMVPADLLIGRGSKAVPGQSRSTFMDEGVLGNGAKWTGALVSGGAEFVGKGAGVTVAAVSMPARGVEESPTEWLKDGSDTGGSLVGKGTGHAMGTTLGAAMDVARIPSIAVKYTLRGAFAVCSGTLGLIAGSIRAIVNR